MTGSYKVHAKTPGREVSMEAASSGHLIGFFRSLADNLECERGPLLEATVTYDPEGVPQMDAGGRVGETQ